MNKVPVLQGRDYFTVTPSDTLDLASDAANPFPLEYKEGSIYVGDTVSRTIKVASAFDGTAARPITFTFTGPGFLPITCKRVFSTGTTATQIVALFDRK